jgi:hypothetical protein
MIARVQDGLVALARSYADSIQFRIPKGERYSKQPFSKLLIGNTTRVGAISNKRWHERTDVVILFPASFSFFADQMKARSCHWILLGIRRDFAIG